MLRREDFIRAGNVVNDYIINGYMAGNQLEPEVLEAMQTLKDGCVELIHIPMWIRKHYAALEDNEDGVSMQDLD